jgi:hypothetical protein
MLPYVENESNQFSLSRRESTIEFPLPEGEYNRIPSPCRYSKWLLFMLV